MIDQDLLDYFLNSHSSIIQFELIEITHPQFVEPIRLVRNNAQGITVTLETAVEATFDYCPMQISKSNRRGDLDFGLSVDLGDVGQIIQEKLDIINDSDSYTTKPAFVYRTYRSDNLLEPLYGPLNLNIETVTLDKQQSSIEAAAPFLSITQTGLIYNIADFPTLDTFQ